MYTETLSEAPRGPHITREWSGHGAEGDAAFSVEGINKRMNHVSLQQAEQSINTAEIRGCIPSGG